MIQRILPYFLLACFLLVGAAMLLPTDMHGEPGNAQRASCQSNLKLIGLALREYEQDHDERLPVRHWVAPLAVYAKTETIFQCPSTPNEVETSDYFFNARYLRVPLEKIDFPAMLILGGDGQDGAPTNITLSQFPDAWRTDEASLAFRHMETANYLFADGHVKALKATRVPLNFQLEN